MHWDSYTVFSVISGIAMLVLAVTPAVSSPKERGYAAVGGVFLLGYGIYVAGQTSGFYVFPATIFVLPFYAVFVLVRHVLRKAAVLPAAARPERQPVAPPVVAAVPPVPMPVQGPARPAPWPGRTDATRTIAPAPSSQLRVLPPAAPSDVTRFASPPGAGL